MMIEKSEADWEAENDARILMDADLITKDEVRFKNAQEAAKRLAAEKEKEVASLSSLANFKYPDMG